MTDNRDAPGSAPERKEARLLPAELGWDEYEPSFRRWAEYNAMQDMAKQDESISAGEYADRKEHLDRWIGDQQRRGKLPSEAEIRGKQVQVNDLMLPYQKDFARRENERMRSDSAYWRRVDDFSDQIKSNIDTERRYTRMLTDCAIAGAAAYGKSLDQVKRDIQDRFTGCILYTPSEYYEFRLDSGDRHVQQQRSDKGADRAGKQEHKSRSGKSREADHGRGR
jgi:hypothetical protein